MKSIIIGDKKLYIKDYYCDGGDGYILRKDGKLWLYVNVTDTCNAHCPFCINNCIISGQNSLDIELFEETLWNIKDYIYGISITGGEPMLCPNLIDEVIDCINKIYKKYIEIDMVTNGYNFPNVLNLKNIDCLDSIHLSRHRVEDKDNDKVFGRNVASQMEIKDTITSLSDPAKIVFNCILMKSGIDNANKVVDFLEFAAESNVSNTCFIGMAQCNDYCKKNYVDPASIFSELDLRFHIWNKYTDHDFCKCSSGSYEAKNRSVRYYYRCIGTSKAPYARQLVYNADNRLLAGFGGEEIHIIE